MSKRREDASRKHTTKVKKRRGVGSRTISVLDSDDEDPLPTTTVDYARVTKTRVGTSGKAEKVATSSVQISDVEKVNAHAPQETDMDGSADAVTENVVLVVPAKRRKKVNDSVSGPVFYVS